MPPVRREQPDVFLLGKPVVQQKHRTSVFRRADHAPCGLQYLVHAGIAVGIIESKAVLCVIITAQHFLLRIYLRQAHTHNGAPDQAAACKINSLTKDAAHHAKTQKCFGRVRHKLSQKFSPSGIIQTAFLHKGANARVTCCKIFVYLPQICVAWEKGKVVSRSGLHQLGQCIRNCLHAGFAVAVAGRNIRQAIQPQIFSRKGTVQCDGTCIAAAQNTAVERGRSQCCTEQRCAAPCGKAGIHKRCRVQTQQLQFKLSAARGKLSDKVAVVSFGGTGDVLYSKIKLQQLCMCFGIRVRFQPILQRCLYGPQRTEQGRGRLLQKHSTVLYIQRFGQFQCGGSVFRQKTGLCRVCGIGLAAVPGCKLYAGFPGFQQGFVCFGQSGL